MNRNSNNMVTTAASVSLYIVIILVKSTAKRRSSCVLSDSVVLSASTSAPNCSPEAGAPINVFEVARFSVVGCIRLGEGCDIRDNGVDTARDKQVTLSRDFTCNNS